MKVPPEVRLKTLVKYKHPNLLLTARFGRKRYVRTAAEIAAVGAGDNTVQEDGLTVWVARQQIERLTNL